MLLEHHTSRRENGRPTVIFSSLQGWYDISNFESLNHYFQIFLPSVFPRPSLDSEAFNIVGWFNRLVYFFSPCRSSNSSRIFSHDPILKNLGSGFENIGNWPKCWIRYHIYLVLQLHNMFAVFDYQQRQLFLSAAPMRLVFSDRRPLINRFLEGSNILTNEHDRSYIDIYS